MAPVDLPVNLLRAFITVSDLGGYTKAAKALHRTQPAISLQMKRLEELVGEKLLIHEEGTVNLTSHGKVLAGFARQILRFNDDAVARFRKPDMQGPLRVGLPTDYALAHLQNVVTAFGRQHDAVALSITCDISRNLLSDLQADRLDVVVALIDAANSRYLVRAWEEQPVWATAANAKAHKTTPLPLVTHPEGCAYRNRIVEALNRDGREWRVAYCSPGITGLQDAVAAGLGVSALTRKTLRDGMRTLSSRDGFPALEKIRIGLFYKHLRQTGAGLALIDRLIAGLDDAADADFKPVEPPSASQLMDP